MCRTYRHTELTYHCYYLENLSSCIDVQPHAGSAHDNAVTFTFDLLTLGSMHADSLPCTVCLPSLMLTVQAVFRLKRGHLDKRTDS